MGTLRDFFRTKTRDVFPSAKTFVEGLFLAERGRRNMERICETIPTVVIVRSNILLVSRPGMALL
jgi:hypothetical protein